LPAWSVCGICGKSHKGESKELRKRPAEFETQMKFRASDG